jgi:hypothetical protein
MRTPVNHATKGSVLEGACDAPDESQVALAERAR